MPDHRYFNDPYSNIPSSNEPYPDEPDATEAGYPQEPDYYYYGPPRPGFPLLKLAIIVGVVIALVGGTVTVLLLRQHHLAQGYLYEGRGQLIYFNVSESFYGGDVIGTFYPTTIACNTLQVVQNFNPHFTGTVDDQRLMLKDEDQDGAALTVTFLRQGENLVLSSASGILFAIVQPPSGAVFYPSSDAGYDQAKQSFCT